MLSEKDVEVVLLFRTGLRLAYGAWRFVVFHLLMGPLFAFRLTTNSVAQRLKEAARICFQD